MTKLYVAEWNINQRSGSKMGGANKDDIPLWISDEITEKADVIILTEFVRHKNWEALVARIKESGYQIKYSDNTKSNQNDVLIGVRNSYDILFEETVPSLPGKFPDFMRIDCNVNNTIVSVIGVRIHADKMSLIEKENEMRFTIEYMSKINNPVLLVGDFNNNRRSTINEWSINKIDKILCEYSELYKRTIKRYTPEGSSITNEVSERGKHYEFPEDHFILSHLSLIDGSMSYYRGFASRDKEIYRWEHDFCGPYTPSNQEFIIPPYPDHAILQGEIEIT